MKHIISYGDPWGDGHCRTENVTLAANYDWEDIVTAYHKTEKKWGYGLTNMAEYPVFVNYLDKAMPKEFFDKLWAAGYFPDDANTKRCLKDYGYDSLEECQDVIAIYMFMAQQELPDLIWNELDDAVINLSIGYGLLE